MKSPYHPGRFNNGSSTSELAARANIPTFTAPVIHQSRYRPVARANSLKPNSASNVMPAMVAARPAKTTASTIGTMKSHPTYVRQTPPIWRLSP